MAKKPKINLSTLNAIGNARTADISEKSRTADAVLDAVKRLENSVNDSVLEPRSAKRILYTKIYSSPLNDYPIENLEETEDLLLLHGLLEPLSVNYDVDQDLYELESGDRRFHALKNLFERFENEFCTETDTLKQLYQKNLHGLYVNGIYCMVENGDRDRDSVRTRIIVHNETARPFDAMRTASKINELSEIYTRQNASKPKSERINVNEKIAELLKGRYTVRQIIRYKNFDSLIEELKNVIINHEMSIAEISKYHSLSEEEQSVLAKYIEEYHIKGTKLELPSIEEIKESVENTISDEVTSCHLTESKEAEEQDEFIPSSPLADNQETQKIAVQNNPPLPEQQKNDLDSLKINAVKKLQETKSKKDTKINDAVDAITKKSKQLEKAVLSYITEEDSTILQLDVDNILSGIDSAIELLNSIKSTLKG